MKPKTLNFVDGRAETAVGDYLVIDYKTVDGTWGAIAPGKVLGTLLDTEAEAQAACQAHFNALVVDMTEPSEPGMFWNANDTEQGHHDIDSVIDGAMAGDVVEIERAARLPNILVLVTESGHEIVATGDAEIAAYDARQGSETK